MSDDIIKRLREAIAAGPTPGPWGIGTPPPNGEQTIGTRQGLALAVATTGIGMEAETLANATYIAAASPDNIRALLDRLDAAERENKSTRGALLRHGFVECDIPACNCGSWHHRYGLPERFREIKDALADAGHEMSNENGNSALGALKALIAQRDAAEAENARLTGALKTANAQAEHFEREWYLRGDENERLREDAERYRWLRGGSDIPQHSTRWARWEVRHWNGRHWHTLYAEQTDDAIDAARREV